MKKIIAMTVIALFGLTACFGDTSENEEKDTSLPPMYKKYEKPDLSIIYPRDWEVLSQSDFTSNVPSSTVVVFRNNIKNDIFTSNLNISQAQISVGTTSEDFAIQTINTQKYNLVGYTEIKREDYVFGDKLTGEKTFIVTFQGRKTVTENLIEFKQLCIARNGYGIIVTAAYLPNEEQSVVIMLDEMIRSLALK